MSITCPRGRSVNRNEKNDGAAIRSGSTELCEGAPLTDSYSIICCFLLATLDNNSFGASSVLFSVHIFTGVSFQRTQVHPRHMLRRTFDKTLCRSREKSSRVGRGNSEGQIQTTGVGSPKKNEQNNTMCETVRLPRLGCARGQF